MQQSVQTSNDFAAGLKTTACSMSRSEREGMGETFQALSAVPTVFTANNKTQKAFQIVTNQEGESVAI